MPDALWHPFSTLESAMAGDGDPALYAVLVEVAPVAADGLRMDPVPSPQSATSAEDRVSRPPGAPESAPGPPTEAPRSVNAGERGQPASGSGTAAAPRSTAATDPSGNTLRDFVRYAFGTIGTPGVIGQRPDRQIAGASAATILIEAVLDAAISTETINIISEVVSPALSPDGFIAMTVAEMGQFIIMFVREAGGFQLIDLNDKSRLSLGGERPLTPRSSPQRGGAAPSGGGGDKLTLGDFLDLIRDFIGTYVLNPLTLGAALFAVAIWVVSRLHGTEA